MSSFGNAAKLFSGSAHAALYAAARPHYPPELYARIFDFAELTHRRHALDVATGSGQAAIELARTFEHVTACDPSAAQLANAVRMPNLTYHQCYGEAASSIVEPASVDLVTCAQALHWFNLDKFYPEMRRVLRPGGTLAAWGYGLLRFTPTDGKKTGITLDAAAANEANTHLYQLHTNVLGPYWDTRRYKIDSAYVGMEYPAMKWFERIERQDLEVEAHPTLRHLLMYLRSWSSYQMFMRAQEESGKVPWDPVEDFRQGLIDSAGLSNYNYKGNFDDCPIAVTTPHFLILAK